MSSKLSHSNNDPLSVFSTYRMTPKQIRTAQTDTPQKLAHVAKPNPSPRKASNQRKRVASTRAARAKAAAKREQEAPQRAQAQEEAKAQRAAERAVKQAQASAQRAQAQAQEEAKAQRAVLRAQAAQAQEEAKAQRAAQRAATRAQAASGCATRKPRCRGAERVGSRWRRVAGACARAHHGG